MLIKKTAITFSEGSVAGLCPAERRGLGQSPITNKKIRLGGLELSSNVLMAPMAGYSCFPFRMMCYELGAGLCFTEMVSCNALKYKDVATANLLFTTKDETIKAAQLIGSDPRVMGKMASSEELAPFAIIDINMGCPVPNVIKRGEGCALLTDFNRASSIIKNVRRSGKITTVKMRVGMHGNNLVAAEFAKMCEESGAEMLSVHGRTRDMMYSGTPFYDQIERIKSVVKIPIIANGGIFSVDEAEKMMDLTGADGVMIARYALENPFIFSELTGTPTNQSKLSILLWQIALTSEYYDKYFTLSYIKKIASYFMKKREGVKKYKLALHNCSEIKELEEVLYKIFE